MAHLPMADTELSHSYKQFVLELSHTRTLADGARCCMNMLESCFSASLIQAVWRSNGTERLLAGSSEPIFHPNPVELQLLTNGQLVLRTHANRVLACFAPLVARAELLGWLYLQQPFWSEESPLLLSQIAGQAAPALALLDIDTRRDEQIAQLHTLNDIGRLLSGVLDLDTLLGAIYTATSQLIDAPMFFIAFYEEPANELELAYMVYDGERQEQSLRWSAAIGLAGIVVRERKPLRTADYPQECLRRDVQPRPFSNYQNSKAWLGVPLLAHDRLLGVLSVSSYRSDYEYSSEHIDVLTTMAAQAAIAIDNARLYQRSERQARQLTTLNRIGRILSSSLDPERVPALIIEQVTELLDAEEASLLLDDELTGELVFTYTTGTTGSQLLGRRLPRGTGIAGYVATHGQSVIVDDVQQDTRFDESTDKTTGYTTRTLLAVPLRGVGGVVGVIEATNRRKSGHFTVEDQHLLEALADQAVIALENARRFAQIDQALARRAQELVGTNTQLQHSLRSLTALNALGMAINTTLRSADEIFSMTARGVVEMTEAMGACVLLEEEGRARPVVQIGPTLPPALEINRLLREVISHGRTEILHTPPAPLARVGVRTILLVPLRATQRTLGSLCIYYGTGAPEAPDREVVVLFATQAAVAVENMELFNAVRNGRDQMGSILASTRDGIMLVTSEGQVAITNAALHQLGALPAQMPKNIRIEHFLDIWEATTAYVPEQWLLLRRELDQVMAGRRSFASGELNEQSATPRTFEWAVLTALQSGGSSGGALLVLRDISEAKESARLRQDLTNMIVHDLRSPLSSVMASIELMQKGVAGELAKTQQSVMSIAYASAMQMLDMINALLDVNRLEAGRMPVNQRSTHMQPLLTRAIDSLSSLAREQHVAIECDFPNEPLLAHADGELIMRVMQNLLGNALKFSGADSTIKLRALVTPPDNHYTAVAVDGAPVPSGTFAVIDEGIGIAPQDQEKIFAKFSQVGERRGGTGLGLTFCRLVVEAHGGRIWVVSTPGKGSTFFFTLPLT